MDNNKDPKGKDTGKRSYEYELTEEDKQKIQEIVEQVYSQESKRLRPSTSRGPWDWYPTTLAVWAREERVPKLPLLGEFTAPLLLFNCFAKLLGTDWMDNNKDPKGKDTGKRSYEYELTEEDKQKIQEIVEQVYSQESKRLRPSTSRGPWDWTIESTDILTEIIKALSGSAV
ncbi:hypothetical protein E3N88_11280 [Mikania micrantha]|uniref:Uncharacterized protein n=1 Tax=Mikania micrantha TaxID=192012 RepID=A0A5N6PE33_9ASTR|nr:hypothetical protein E3N88_11280 [Mikania micrantha]